jgi:hypothetical protein
MKPSKDDSISVPTAADARFHEEALIKAFIVARKHARMISLLANQKRRSAITNKMGHFRDLDPRYARRLPPSVHNASAIEEFLKSKGAPPVCYAISEDSSIDGHFLRLVDALTVVGSGFGTFLSCIPGRLAYFEDEDDRFILENRNSQL